MQKHEIHLRFMESALNGIASIPGDRSTDISDALRHADAALDAYLARWPDVKFED